VPAKGGGELCLIGQMAFVRLYDAPAMATVTLLFTDLVGSTEILSRLGDDRNESLRRTHFRLLRDAAAAHDGQEVKSLGDGLMVVFDSVVDAVDCAVTMQRAVEDHNRSGGATARNEAMAIRVGLHIGEPIRNEGDYFGAAVVVAKRLCDAAGSGKILVSELVRGILGGRSRHPFVAVGALELKGIPEPVPACEVEWQVGRHEVELPPLLTLDTAPAFGREVELSTIVDAVGSSGDRGRLVLLAGEPGIGKTRLAAEAARRVHAPGVGATVLYGRCDDDVAVPYQPFVELVRHYFWSIPAEAGSLVASATDLARLVPELTSRLRNVSEPLSVEPDVERVRLLDAVRRFFEEVAREGPLLVVIDDVHWSDLPSLAILRHLVRHGLPAGVTVLATYRDIEVDRRHPLSQFLADLRRDGELERVLLRGLDRAAIVEMLEGRSGSPIDEAGRALADALLVETEGNPFFVREILRHLVESGALHQVGARWTNALPLERIGLPESVRDVVGRRLSRLGETCNDVLRVASVLGREFGLDVVADAMGLSSDDVADAIDEAVRARVVAESPSGFDRYSFTHMLIRETLYGEITTSRRVRLHARIGEVLERSGSGDVAELARHFREAAILGDPSKAAEYGLSAGDRAMAMIAYEEALQLYDQTLQVLADAPGASPSVTAELHLRRGEALLAIGESAAAREAFVEASSVARSAGDPERLGRAALGVGGLWPEVATIDDELRALLEESIASLEPLASSGSASARSLRCRVLGRLAMEFAFTAELGLAESLSAESLSMARELGDPAALAYAEIARRHALTGPSHLEERLSIMSEAVAIADGLGDLAMGQRARAMYQSDATEAGDLATATSAMEGLLHVADVLRQPRYVYLATIARAVAAHREGRLDEAESHALQAREMAVALGRMTGLLAADNLLVAVSWDRHGPGFDLSRLEPWAPLHAAMYGGPQAFDAMIALGRGDHDGARAAMRSLAIDVMGAPMSESRVFMWCAAAVMVNDVVREPVSAARVYELLLPFASRHLHLSGTGLTVYTCPVSAALGVQADALEHWADAERWYRQGIVESEAMRCPAAAARCRLALASVLSRDGGDGGGGDGERGAGSDEAVWLATEARDAFERIGMQYSLERAERFLAG
jgi:class 3 adenylate cyclase/tetratricopeptide (TPR) repeat protein